MLTKLKSALLTKSSPVLECPQKKKKATSPSSIAIVELYPSLCPRIQPITVSVCMSQLLQVDVPALARRPFLVPQGSIEIWRQRGGIASCFGRRRNALGGCYDVYR